MPEIQAAALGRKLQARYNLTGVTPVPSLSPELVAVTLVDDLTAQDTADPAFERPVGGFIAITPAAGDVARLHLSNPPNSGIILTAKSVRLYSGTLQECEVVIVNGGTIAGAAGRQFMDGRIKGFTGVSAGQLGATTQVAAALQYYQIQAAPTTRIVFEIPFVLDEDQGILIMASAAATALSGSFLWTERTKGA